jgi:hypothetical protein
MISESSGISNKIPWNDIRIPWDDIRILWNFEQNLLE